MQGARKMFAATELQRQVYFPGAVIKNIISLIKCVFIYESVNMDFSE